MKGQLPTAEAKFRVAIVDAQPLFRLGTLHALQSWRRLAHLVEGSSARDALQFVEARQVDILLMDCELPGCSDVVAAIGRLRPAVRIIIVSRSRKSQDLRSALHCGGHAVVHRNVGIDELVQALDRVATGDRFAVSPTSARRPGPAASSRAVTVLTPREQATLALVAVGATNKEIARNMSISEKTVKCFMTSILRKLRVRNRVEAVRVAMTVRGDDAG